jgi:hypothetical protein
MESGKASSGVFDDGLSTGMFNAILVELAELTGSDTATDVIDNTVVPTLVVPSA